MPVFYSTNRARRGARGEAYGPDRGALEVGRCLVEFRPVAVLDRLAARLPFHVPSESEHLAAIRQQAPQDFWVSVDRALAATASRTLVLFVHGYSHSFARACRMGAALQRTVGEGAAVLVFSWPSNGRPTDYLSDQADLEWSVPALADLMQSLSDRFGAERIHLLTHSLGSRGVFFALQRLATARGAERVAGRLTLLAPDFDSATFRDLLPKIAGRGGRVTLYASARDTLLRISAGLNGHPRLGQAGDHLTVLAGMDTIDVTPAGRYQLLGHEYFRYHPGVAADLGSLLVSGAAAESRSGLRRSARGALPYWELMP